MFKMHMAVMLRCPQTVGHIVYVSNGKILPTVDFKSVLHLAFLSKSI